MTPKMKATLYEDIRETARKLFLSSNVVDLCKDEATPKQEELNTKFFSVTELVLKLAEDRKQGTLEKMRLNAKPCGILD